MSQYAYCNRIHIASNICTIVPRVPFRLYVIFYVRLHENYEWEVEQSRKESMGTLPLIARPFSADAHFPL